MKKNKNAQKSNQNVTKGEPGAPKKAVKYPRGSFTVASAIKLNAGRVCGLTVRTRIAEDVESGLLVENGNRPQAGGKAGRPSTLYILASQAKNVKVTKTVKPAKSNAIKSPRKVKSDTVTLAPVIDVAPAAPVSVTPVVSEATVTPVAVASPVSDEKEIPAVVPAPLP